MSENEMIIVDGDSPPPLTSLSIKTPEATFTNGVTIKSDIDVDDNDNGDGNSKDVDTTATITTRTTPPTSSPPALLPSSLDPSSKIAQLIVKETRKLQSRSKEEVSDTMNDDTPSTMSTDNNNSSSDEVDEIDTDDLLDQADLLPPLRNKRANMTTAQLVNSTSLGKSTGRGKKRRRGRGVSKTKTKTKKLNSTKRGRVKQPILPPRPRIEDYVYEPETVDSLSKQYPDTFWRFHADTEYPMLDVINEDHSLTSLNYHISDQAAIVGMTLSPDGTILVTFSSVGFIKLWDVTDEFKMIRRLRDSAEANIEEFYCGQFVDNQELLVAGGKLKDRFRWSAQDDDNHILPCPVKVFNIETGHRVAELDGHMEEILCIKALQFKEENYYITTSQDGYIIKWHMDKDWITLLDSTRMEDGITCMAFNVSFLPNTGNKFFLAACDGHLRLFDFEESLLLQTFEDMYSSYCDCGKFVKWLDAPSLKQLQEEQRCDASSSSSFSLVKQDDTPQVQEQEERQHAWFISRGAEMCDVGEGISSIPNTCTLHKLTYPNTRGGKFQLDQVKKFTHEDYHANSWLVKITSNGRYLLAPTIYGQIFVFNMSTSQLTAILKEHEDMEVRDVIFHPYRPLLFSCGDDGSVKIYTYKNVE
ncbi:WD40-repeat-containing domain protein [Phascolomyces articulosus]|uniref:WD40-repeat-containing domain protein n=1 Tax=Phascolomyces articulosus TaxID=60185 RepID=A0AAD5JTC0_9FUNG|nr:WD40-repeat-containing domain protein [Phascolomyces articulosus]